MKPLLTIFVLLLSSIASAAEVIPPAPSNYFNDYAGVVSSTTAQRLNSQLRDFEKQTSNQVLVVIYPNMQSDSSLEDYTVRLAEKWGVGQKQKKNGVVLFVFIADHKMRIEVGYGLEGALPDATCEQIISEEIAPKFKAGDYAAGLNAGVKAIMAATQGEYKGNGSTVGGSQSSGGFPLWLIIIAIFIIFNVISAIRRGTTYGGYGRSSGWFWGPLWWGMMNSGGTSRGGGNWGGGGFGGGGGGGFTGGGGSFGGGGASGSW